MTNDEINALINTPGFIEFQQGRLLRRLITDDEIEAQNEVFFMRLRGLLPQLTATPDGFVVETELGTVSDFTITDHVSNGCLPK